MKHRYIRLQIAFKLAGYGAASRFAMDCNTTLDNLLHSLSGKVEKGRNNPRKSWRLEQLADAFILTQFKKHRLILDLEGNP